MQRLQALSRLLKDRRSFESAADHLFEEMAPAPPQALWDSLFRCNLLAELLGLWDGRPGGPLSMARGADDPLALPFPEALRWFRSKRVVTADQLRTMTQDARLESFWVAGVTDRRVVQGMHNSLYKAIDQGTGFYDFVSELDEITDRVGAQPFKLHHLATTFDTNMASAYSAGRYQQMMRARRTRPIWAYHALLDSKTRPDHRSMHGVRARWDDPIWATWYTPNGFRCRCAVRSETEDQAREAGWTPKAEPPSALRPDKGFAQSPALAQESRKVGWDVAEVTHRRGLLPSTAVDRKRYQRVAGNPDEALAVIYQRGFEAMARSRDVQRAAQLRQGIDWTDDELVEALRTTRALNFYDDQVDLAPKKLTAHLNMYSQNTATVRAMAARLAMTDELSSVRTRIRPGSKKTLFRGYDRTWEQVELARDQVLWDALGDAEPTMWSSEVVLEIELDTPAQAARLARLVDEEFSRDEAGSVALSWWVPDLRFLGPGADQVAPDRIARVWLNRHADNDRIVTLSSTALDGWNSQVISVNRSLRQAVVQGEVAAAGDATP